MCVQVRNVETLDEAESPAELRRMLGVKDLILAHGYSTLNEECCLCQVDVEATVKAAGWKYAEVDHDFMDVEVTPPSRQSEPS